LKKLTKEAIEFIKKQYAGRFSDADIENIMHLVESYDLDPTQKHFYVMQRGGNVCIHLGIDGFRLIAERTGKYCPGSDTQFVYDDKGALVGAKVFVKKLTSDGTWHEVSATALLREYSTRKALWNTMPHVMIEKCAEARALRRAFPAQLGGMYSEEEMQQAKTTNSQMIDPPESTDRGKDVSTSPIISEKTWDTLNEYLNGHDDLRKQLCDLCQTTDLSQITEYQLPAVRKYAKMYFKKSSTSEQEG
jgi:phage recombination protein Bet